MRPLKLTLNEFQSYKHSEINFEKLGRQGLYLIDGPTGAGKTTLFQAILFALFNETTDSSVNSQSLRNINADVSSVCRVELTFEEKGKTYCVSRSPAQTIAKKRGDGTKFTNMEAYLYEVVDGKQTTLLAKNSGVENYIIKLLGLTADQFQKTILIPQGKFRDVLTCNSDERSKIFRSLFKTGLYNDFSQTLNQMNNEASKAVENKRNEIITTFKVANLAPENQSDFENLKLSSTAAEKLEFLNSVKDSYAQKVSEFSSQKKELESKRQEYTNLKNQYDKYNENRKNIEQKKNSLSSLEQERKIYEYKKLKLDSQATLVDTYKEEVISINKSLNDYDSLSSNVIRLNDEAESLKDSKDDLVKLQAKESQTKESIESIQAKLDSITENPSDLQKTLMENVTKCTNLQNKISNLNSDFNSLASSNASISKHSAACIAAKSKYEEKSKELNTKTQAYLSNSAGILAKELEDDKPCPVCGSTIHPSPAKSFDSTVTAEELHDCQDECTNALRKMQGCITSLELAKEDKKKYLDKLLKELHVDEEKEIGEAINKLNEEYRDLSNSNNQESKKIKQLESQIKELNNSKVENDKSLITISEDLSNCKIKIAKCESNIANLNSSIADLKQRLQYPSKSAAVSHRNDLNGKIESFNKELKETENNINKTSADIQSTQVLIDSLQDSIDEFEKGNHTLTLSDINSTITDLICQITDLDTAIQNFHSYLNSASKTSDLISKNIDEIKEAEAKANQLARLATAFCGKEDGSTEGKTTIEMYVQSIQLDKIIEKANRRFEKMTNDRFSLVKATSARNGKSKYGLDIDVKDKYSGECRWSSTLSGGESFMAALSLALGLQDTVVCTTSGVDIDCMFIDEGFGTLDSNALDNVLSVLKGLTVANGSTLIGLISHVEDLEKLIPQKIVISKDKDGNSSAKLIV